MARKYRDYTDKDIIDGAAKCESLSALLKILGLKQAGGNFSNMKRNLQRLKVDTKHWTGSAWSKDQRLKDWGDYTKANNCKPHLIKEKGHQCENCKRKEWLRRKIALEIHHKDGDRTNNRIENLQLLCPNCHAQTENWRGKK